jgi:chromosome partitioning protein
LKIIAIAGGKGGIGKTFASTSLAVEFSTQFKHYKNVLLVDLDPSRNSAVRLLDDISIVDKTILDLMKDRAGSLDPSAAIYEANKSNFPGVSLLAGTNQLDYIDEHIAGRKNPDFILKKVLQRIKGFDLCILDCPPNRGTLVSNALVACDAYITPYVLDVASIDGVLAIETLIDELESEEVISKRPRRLGAFCSNYEKPNSISGRDLKDLVEEKLNNNIINVKVPSTVHVRDAILHGGTLQFDRDNKVCQQYRNLAKFVQKNIGGK